MHMIPKLGKKTGLWVALTAESVGFGKKAEIWVGLRICDGGVVCVQKTANLITPGQTTAA